MVERNYQLGTFQQYMPNLMAVTAHCLDWNLDFGGIEQNYFVINDNRVAVVHLLS